MKNDEDMSPASVSSGGSASERREMKSKRALQAKQDALNLRHGLGANAEAEVNGNSFGGLISDDVMSDE